MLLVGGRFFMENRNFHSTKRGLMASKIPMKPQIGYNKCKFVIINTLCTDKNGNEILLRYHQLKPGVTIPDKRDLLLQKKY